MDTYFILAALPNERYEFLQNFGSLEDRYGLQVRPEQIGHFPIHSLKVLNLASSV